MIVNGQEKKFKEGITVLELLNDLKIEPTHVAVEVDLDIVDKDKFEVTKLDSSSKVEIIRFVGGG
ncbi:sulfur carrier protein ThiS [Clostridium tyrobutyricum]|jgi:sulfur carrier protein|uniref:sulfur carrier protein ThiS n=1 Tax=Clostridium tyrobutyricum TaxID=1519 RepID=UPI0002FAA0A8|nr:sulfur carrier protein ThiS [Clostridium tyrobutyricum]MBV4421426.1 sulfur carrier protein ThiS [Clostridium tyrobutyricum]MBV4424959.1 sulfur carrier protein ThiS [Clostridium tyrobutyricum]MBV4436966.1 sulfur carrier protein ThiS [Clostridium tyrobutyricum]MEA5008866.1 sulfur carrier protein ThiS [Clostridium tyrobutyricum]